jgi:hypothetical protein
MQKDYNRLLAGNVDFGGMAIGSMHTPNDERAFSSSKFIWYLLNKESNHSPGFIIVFLIFLWTKLDHIIYHI